MRLSYVSLVLATSPLALAACSDPVPATPQGAWSVSFSHPSSECTLGGHNMLFGEVDSESHKQIMTDGADGADVSCNVAGSSSFKVSANAGAADRSLNIEIAAIDPSATIDNPAHGAVSYASAKTGGSAYSTADDEPCNFYFVEDTQETVAAGKLWVAFQCPSMVLSGSYCGISQGYAIFQNCSQNP